MARSGEGHPAVTAALVTMGVLRQASDVDSETIDLYAATLAEEHIPLGHIIEACKQIGREPRGDGESAFPSLGTLVERCHRAGRQLAYRALAPSEDKPEPITPEQATKLLADIREAVAGRAKKAREA